MMKPQTSEKPRPSNGSDRWAARQDEILDTAAKLFARHGYSETDAQLLADEVHVGKGTLYRYFHSKQDLFLAAADRVMIKLRHRIDGDIASIGEPLDRIVR